MLLLFIVPLLIGTAQAIDLVLVNHESQIIWVGITPNPEHELLGGGNVVMDPGQTVIIHNFFFRFSKI